MVVEGWENGGDWGVVETGWRKGVWENGGDWGVVERGWRKGV